MAAAAAEAAEVRLSRQERELRWLAAEVGRLKEPQEPLCPGSASPELQRLRAENEKLRYRLLHLRRSLAAELGRAAPAQPPAGGEKVSSASPTDAVVQIKEEKTKENEAVNQHQNDLQCMPSFIEDRLKLYEVLKKEHDALLAYRAANQSKSIKITLTDGEMVEGESWRTTPYQLAVGISQVLASNAVIAKVNGELWDLDRPWREIVYWHSSAHILGEAMEGYFGGCLCYGPPIENGFHYDMYIEDRYITSRSLNVPELLYFQQQNYLQ
ncbi:threonine--tRNA ligase 2, cytoplasmic-like [Catharus ustulatus]|uniref:threonine--tRNA ligase 2, cytoplasmic-like n=1 Tax=Catharus ustulatus TaxID=91951 RepID=UPI00140D183F|nr:threonine--tRNA ligase 2, cytoplasmic-like [Catharus ustulatus]